MIPLFDWVAFEVEAPSCGPMIVDVGDIVGVASSLEVASSFEVASFEVAS